MRARISTKHEYLVHVRWRKKVPKGPEEGGREGVRKNGQLSAKLHEVATIHFI